MGSKKPTYGESRLQNLMNQLPSDEFYCYAEPRLDDSQRCSRYPDFVVVWRSYGVICIEVKDWIHIIDGDQREIKVESKEGLHIYENPYETARNYTYLLKEKLEQRRELLQRHQGRERLAFPVEPLVVLANQDKTRVSWFVDQHYFPEDRTLSSDDLESVQTFRRALSRLHWTFKLHKEISDPQIEIIRHTLKLVEVRAKPTGSTEGTGSKQGSLTVEQDDIIWAPLPNEDSGISVDLIRGVAGSGKTIVLSKRAELLAELRPDLKMLVTTFQIDLLEDLKKRITNTRIKVSKVFDLIKEILGDDYPRIIPYRGDFDPLSSKHWCEDNEDLFTKIPSAFVAQEISRRKDLRITSEEEYRSDLKSRRADLSNEEIDELCTAFDLYQEYQESLKREGKGWQDYEDTVGMALQAIHSHYYHRYFDVILADEGQDFPPRIFELLRSLIRPGGYLFICDDPLQSIWREYDLADRKLNNPRTKKRLLKLPLRTSREIADLAQSIFEMVPEIHNDDDGEIYPAPTQHLKSGTKPFLFEFKDRDSENSAMLERVKKYRSDNTGATIGILTPERSSYWRKSAKELGVYSHNFNLLKGLEFDAVFIPNLDELFSSRWNERKVMKRWIYRKLFVAITRARRDLYISYAGQLPEFLIPLKHYCLSSEDPNTSIVPRELPTV